MNGNLAYKLEPREELIDGKLIMMASVRINHTRIAYNISRIFGRYLEGRKCEYFPDSAGLYLEDGKEEYEPDGMIVCDPDKVTDKGVVGVPDFVLEVLSPGTEKYDRGHKKDVYERHGVREYWLVNPVWMSVEQYVLENGKFVLRDVYHKYPASQLADMKEEERAAVVKEFRCSLFDDLVISLDEIFGRVVVGG